MIANILIGSVIFGYAGWALLRHIKKSKQGECGSCSSKSSCSSCSSEIKSSLK
ncbi:FeoB-associated Cys-rich membrane protein [Niallia endozanthoxylica]|uniref:FeoB-associated Cys-rich membrane protein n=1 Tax=Niallia endozanthoxylica TaxID=2036016 RepID=A0A5J5I752_9BACI|nr:FeoB-associated Cys-rich membrane protein [Niallia endozanthoxylica]KAA9031632.1 FeoB-associated Cys-rich membrane protein [Niallia endozanthoxylica]